MATLADIQRANSIGAQITEQNDRRAAEVFESVAPYVDTLSLDDNQKYAQITEDRFKELLAEPGGKEVILGVINSSPIATSYKDINTQKVEKGRVIDFKETDQGIAFEVETKQGVFPKTLGFSNDPKDVVMFTDTEGLRAMTNTILQRQSYRLTGSRKGFGSRVQALTTLGGIEASQNPISQKLEQAGSVPEAVDVIEGLVESGELDPAQGFELLIEMGSDFNDGLDAYREKLRRDLAENKGKRTSLTKKAKPVFGTGVSGSVGDGTAGRLGNPVRMAGGNTEEERKEIERLEAEAVELRGRLKDSELVFPMYSSPEAMFSFVKQNEDLMIEVGGDQNILDKARAAFNKYNVAAPEDLNKLPDYDSSIDISKAEIAAAIAVTAGGDFSTEFQDAYRLLATGDASTSPMQVQQFDRESMNMNARLDQYITESNARIRELQDDRAKDIATKLNSELKDFTSNIIDSESGEFRPQKLKGEASVNFRNIINFYDQANQLGLFRGPEGLEMDGYFRNALGTTMFNLIRAEGVDPTGLGRLFSFFRTKNPDMPLGDPTASLRAKYKENRKGEKVLDEIIAVDSQGNQVGKELTGAKYSNIFNDVVTAQYVSRYIQEYQGN
tara:strand:+ start:521 stop:2362 length:1842 start_codon:yes stop_codon:yes gene_type:complete